MCIATVYAGNAGRMEKIMQDVISVDFDDQGILLTTILGEEKLLDAGTKIKHIDFLKHSVTVESG